MPLYTIHNNKTNEEKEVNCSYEELLKLLDEGSDWTQVLSAPKTISGIKDARARTPDGFKDVLKRIKSGSDKSNTINV